MIKLMGRIFSLCFILISPIVLAQSHTITGILRDRAGDKLGSAHIFVYPDSVTTLSNEGGRFTLSVARGTKTIVISHVAYETFSYQFIVRRDTSISFTLAEKVSSLKEVVVTGDRN